MSFEIKTDNPNYLAQVVKLPAPRPHPNANKLQLVTIMGQTVITGLTAKEGDIYIYFPLECVINRDYLSWSNSFSDAELNADKTKKGFFPSVGRVKAVRLRSVPSEGYIVPASDLGEWLKIKITEEDVGAQFSHYKDILICEKYINTEALRKLREAEAREKNKNKKAKHESKLVENQFRVAEDTQNLKRNIEKINLDDVITISYKMHGCNFSAGRVLCKRSLNWHEKLLKKIGVKINETHYDLVYASRRVIKNAYADEQKQGYYDVDVWSIIAEKYKDAIKDNIVLYGEIVGQLPNGKWIQTSYDYGCAPNTCEAYIYRGTIVNNKGDVFEMTTPQLERYCKKVGLKMVPIFYYGTVRNYIKMYKEEFSFFDGEYLDFENSNWREELLNLWVKKYNEKDCYMCKNKLPEEGVVLVRESDFFEGYKLKSFKFLERESAEADKGEVNMEDVS